MADNIVTNISSSMTTDQNTQSIAECATTISQKTPKQDELRNDISQLQEQILALIHVRNAGLITDELLAKTKKLKKEIEQKDITLKRLKREASRQRRRRANLKRTLEEIVDEQPSLTSKLAKFTRGIIGRPAVIDDQPELLDAIVNIASIGAAASDRRRSEELRSCKTLDDLHLSLSKQGFLLSRSATYVRLLPKRSSTFEGKRHVKTVPVKLIRLVNTARDRHIDAPFAFASMQFLEEICSMFGPKSCFYLSIDDKAKVAATKQAPILMHVNYEIRLPDHDFVVASRHNLIPSVYAACNINAERFSDAVSYSGPTYIAIRSMKYDSSTAHTYGCDMERLLTLDSFKPLICTPEGPVKPICVVASDGGPDTNPRFPKTLQVAAARFVAWDLDVYLSGTHAPHYSAYNRVERRMAPLSRELAGLVLPRDHFGTHLDASGKTVDQDLEKKNFVKAAETLAEVWSSVSIDNYSVHAEYVEPTELTPTPDPNATWIATHVRQSQYSLIIVKCDVESCCRPWRCSWKRYFPNRFLPGPVVLSHAADGIGIPDPDTARNNPRAHFSSLSQRLGYVSTKICPITTSFDLYCPSISNAEIQKRTFNVCGIYHASQASMKRHQSMHTESVLLSSAVQVEYSIDYTETSEHDDESSAMITTETEIPTDHIPVIRILFDWLKAEFESD